MTIYIVWNAARTEGYATTDAQVAYEARKGSDTNCYNAEGEQMKLAQAFCDLTGEESCTIERVDSVEPEAALWISPSELERLSKSSKHEPGTVYRSEEAAGLNGLDDEPPVPLYLKSGES